MAKKNEKPEFREFYEIPKSGIKEILNKNRKYDSFVDEHRRIFQYGKTIRVKFSEDNLKPLFIDTILDAFKTSGFKDVKEKDLYEGKIIQKLDKKGKPVNRIKIAKYETKTKRCILTFQLMQKDGEIRTTIDISRPMLFGQDKYAHITFIQLFKRDDTLFGVGDEMRKRYMRNTVIFRAAKLAEKFLEKNMLKGDQLPTWASRSLKAAGKRNYVGFDK